MLISNVSFPKNLEEDIALKGGNALEMIPYLVKSIGQLEKGGADFIVLPCNTLHVLLPELRKYSNIPFIDLIEEVSRLIEIEYKKIGILSTTKTRNEKLYDCELKGVDLVYPSDEEQEEISKIIIRIIRGESNYLDRCFLERVVHKLMEKGAEKVLLACTDLGNLMKDNPFCVDSTEILIKSLKKKVNSN